MSKYNNASYTSNANYMASAKGLTLDCEIRLSCLMLVIDGSTAICADRFA